MQVPRVKSERRKKGIVKLGTEIAIAVFFTPFAWGWSWSWR